MDCAFLSTLSFNSKIILSAVFLPTPGHFDNFAISSLRIYALSCGGVAQDSIPSPTFGPILETDVNNLNISNSFLLANPHKLISSSLTINLVKIFASFPF